MTPSADQFSSYIIIQLNSRTIVASLLDSVYLMSQLVSTLLYYVFLSGLYHHIKCLVHGQRAHYQQLDENEKPPYRQNQQSPMWFKPTVDNMHPSYDPLSYFWNERNAY
jgi:hypothetical protein